MPLVVPVNVIQPALDVADQLQPAPAATLTLPDVPAAAAARLPGESVYVHGAAAWFTVNVWPPIATVPLRAAPVLAATLYGTDPVPVPLAAPVNVDPARCCDVADQLQPAPAATLTLPDVPAAAADQTCRRERIGARRRPPG